MMLKKNSEPINKDNFIRVISNMDQKELNQLIKEKGKKSKRMSGFLIVQD